MKINERSKFIINELIKRNTYVTASEIADLLQVSIKTVTRQLVNVEKILNENDLILERKTSKGVIIKGKTAYGCSNWKSGCQYRQPFSQM